MSEINQQLQDELNNVILLLGNDAVKCVGNSIYEISFQNGTESIIIRYNFPLSYPNIPPIINIESQRFQHLDKPNQITKYLSNITTFLRNVPYLEYSVHEIYNIFFPTPKRVLSQTVLFPDPLEESHLTTCSYLNREARNYWIKEQISKIQSSPGSKITSSSKTSLTNAFLVYFLHLSSESNLSLEECKQIFLNNECIKISNISQTEQEIQQTVMDSLKQTSILIRQQLFHSDQDSYHSFPHTYFFDDFSVMNLIYNGYLRARNKADQRIYLIRATRVSNDCVKIPEHVAKLKHLQHK